MCSPQSSARQPSIFHWLRFYNDQGKYWDVIGKYLLVLTRSDLVDIKDANLAGILFCLLPLGAPKSVGTAGIRPILVLELQMTSLDILSISEFC